MASTANGNGRRAERLKSWKEIAAFFGTDERTVRRWEERGLPVRRVPGGGRATVFADIAELQAWLHRSSQPAVGAPAQPPDASPAFPRYRAIAAAGAALLLAAAAGGVWLSTRAAPPAEQRHEPSRAALNLYLTGTYESERMTLESLRRAVSLFGQAIAEDPAYAEPYAGLANAWLRLRAFGVVSEVEAYRRARAAAERALELDPNLPQAHASMGFIRFYRDWAFEDGLAHFRKVSELDPRAAAGRHSYGMALLHVGRFAEALAEIDAAQRLDPRSPSIRAERGIALYLAGRETEGLAVLREMAAEQPDFIQPHRFLAMIHFGEGDYRTALDHVVTIARLSDDSAEMAMAVEARRSLESGGPRAMLLTMLRNRERPRRAGPAPAYAVAQAHAMLGDRAAALRYLRQSIEAREPEALIVRIDPTLRALRGSAEFRALSAQLGLPG